MLDRLPAWARHGLIIFGAVFALTFAQAIVAEGGVWPFPWLGTLRAGLNGAAVAVCGVAVLALTTVTRQYGAGSLPPIPTDPALEQGAGDDA